MMALHKIKLLACVLLLSYVHISFGQDGSMTLALVKDFHKAWNEENLELMASKLAEDAFFKSPFQLRYSRDTMLSTVLRKNPKIYKVIEIEEDRSQVRGNIAWSIGHMISEIHDDQGNSTDRQWHNDYVYQFVFEDDEWKLLMMLYHE